jgi:hypothetical protein
MTFHTTQNSKETNWHAKSCPSTVFQVIGFPRRFLSIITFITFRKEKWGIRRQNRPTTAAGMRLLTVKMRPMRELTVI